MGGARGFARRIPAPQPAQSGLVAHGPQPMIQQD
jgi:hypothetical protein